MEVCLACAHEEWNDALTACPDCGGRLWHPENVAGIPGHDDSRMAAQLIRRGLKPWQPDLARDSGSGAAAATT